MTPPRRRSSSLHPPITTEISTAEGADAAISTYDTVKVPGLGSGRGDAQVDLFGPYASAAAVKCTGTPFRVADALDPRRRHVHDDARRRHHGRDLHLPRLDRRRAR